jgi:predicted helicase
MERYQMRIDSDSDIRNDPNDWADEHGKPSYILDRFAAECRDG